MKTLVISVIAALLVLWATTEAFGAPTVRDCEAHADTIVVPMATARDQGMPPQVASHSLLSVGFSVVAVQIIVGYIYITHKDNSPETIREIFMRDCAGEGL